MNNTNNHHTPRQQIQTAKELTSELLFQETLLGSFVYYLSLIIFVLGLVTILFLSGFIITIIVLIILWCTCLTYLFYFNYGEPSSFQDLPLDIKQILRFISVFMSTIYKLPSYAPLIIPYLSSSLNYRNSKDDNLFKDIKYNKFNNLDIYSTVKPLPNKLSAVIVFVYGGAWSSGDKSIYQLIGRKYQNMGYTVVILNYSWYPKGTIELMISNINDGVNWVRNNIHNFGGDPEQITLIGHSAGAHLCLSVHLLKVISRLDFDQLEQNPEVQASGMKLSALSNLKSVNLWLKKDFKKFQTILEDSDELETIKLDKIILISGVYNIQNHFSFESYRGIEFLSAMARAMGSRNSTRSRIRASPSAWLTWLGDLELMSEVTEALPNKGLTLLHGEQDATVPYSSSELLFYQLKRLMSITDQEHLLQFYLTPEMDHTDPNFGLMLNNHKFSPLMEELLPSKL